MDKALHEAIMRCREQLKDPKFWEELEAIWDKREIDEPRPLTHEEMNEPFTL